MSEYKEKTKLVCGYHGTEVIMKKTKNGIKRKFCTKCDKYLNDNQIVSLTAQIFDILQELNTMDIHLGNIWEIAFYNEDFPKMHKGIPEYGLGELFVTLHDCQRKILGWRDNQTLRKFGQRPSNSYDTRIKKKRDEQTTNGE